MKLEIARKILIGVGEIGVLIAAAVEAGFWQPDGPEPARLTGFEVVSVMDTPLLPWLARVAAVVGVWALARLMSVLIIERWRDDRQSPVTSGIISAILTVQIAVTLTGGIFGGFAQWLILKPQAFVSDPLLHLPQLITHIGTHVSPLHALANALALWAFGASVERSLPGRQFVALFLCCGITAALLCLPFALGTNVAGNGIAGASGAISSLLGFYAVQEWGRRVDMFIFGRLLPLPASVGALGWIAAQAVAVVALETSAAGHVAAANHVCGALTGMAVAAVLTMRQTSNEVRFQ